MKVRVSLLVDMSGNWCIMRRIVLKKMLGFVSNNSNIMDRRLLISKSGFVIR